MLRAVADKSGISMLESPVVCRHRKSVNCNHFLNFREMFCKIECSQTDRYKLRRERPRHSEFQNFFFYDHVIRERKNNALFFSSLCSSCCEQQKLEKRNDGETFQDNEQILNVNKGSSELKSGPNDYFSGNGEEKKRTTSFFSRS